MLRHLPPTASPVSISDMLAGIRAGLLPLWGAQSGSKPRGPQSPLEVALHQDGAYAGSGDDSTQRFQTALADYLDVSACLLAASGRTALYMLLAYLAQLPENRWRDQVILPAYTCPSLVRVVLDAGLKPRLVDINEDLLAPALAEVTSRLSEQTLAVVHVHPFGLPIDLADRSHDLVASTHAAGAVLIEDAAQSQGAVMPRMETIRPIDARVGTQGDFGLFSLGPGKPLSTGGGGFISINRKARADHLPRLSEAWRQLPPAPRRASVVATARLGLLVAAFHPRGWWWATRAGAQRFGEREGSWGYRLSGLSRAQVQVGLRRLPKLDDLNRLRRGNARLLLDRLEPYRELRKPPRSMLPDGIFLRLPVWAADQEQREALYHELWKRGIGVGRMYRKALHEIFPELAEQPFPGAESVARRLLTMPTHPYLEPDDLDSIGLGLKSVLDSV